MTDTRDDDARLLVHAYLDGELGPADTIALERRMMHEPALAAERSRIEALRRVLQERLPPAALPPTLRQRVEASLGLRARMSRPSWRALAASVALSAIVAGGSTWALLQSQQRDGIADSIVANHVRSLMASQPTDVASSDGRTLRPSFNGGIQQAAPVAAEDRRVEERAAREREAAERARARAERARRELAEQDRANAGPVAVVPPGAEQPRTAVDTAPAAVDAAEFWVRFQRAAPRVVDLSRANFSLVGGRIDVIDRKPVSTLVYRRRQHVISLTAVPAEGRAAPSAPRTIDGYNLLTWNADGVIYWATSDLNVRELGEFAAAFRTAP